MQQNPSSVKLNTVIVVMWKKKHSWKMKTNHFVDLTSGGRSFFLKGAGTEFLVL